MSEMLKIESYTDQEITCILRDLAIHENLDVKKLFDNYKQDEMEKKTKYKNNAYKIRQINKKRLVESHIKRDLERLDYFKELDRLDDNIFDEISNFKTEKGKKKMKMKLLKIAYKKNITSSMINLYLQVLSDTYESKSEKKLMDKITSKMKTINYKRMQFEELSNQLSPLDFYNDYKKKLDNWQIKTLNYIDKGKSVIVCAPTSCGKTWLSIYPGIIGKKVLFLVPTTALIYQVSAIFNKFGAKINIISSEFTYGSEEANVIVGTPKDIEDNLVSINNDFDIVIYDEIHNLSNKEFGIYYERLVKVFKDKQILALSATIGNPKKLISWFNRITGRQLSLITYSTRFLNLQRHIFSDNKNLCKIHPISCLSIDDITEKFLYKNLPMTPYDCIKLYDTLKFKFGESMNDLDINNVFKRDNARLSLDDARKYELLLKERLIKLKESHRDDLIKLLNSYNIIDNNPREINLYNLFREIKSNNLTPCIVFQENTLYCKDIFTKLVTYLEKLEQLNYPFHYDNLEFANKCYNDAIEAKNKYKSTIKFSSDFVGNKNDALEEMLDKKWEKLNYDFKKKWENNYEKQVHIINKSNENEKIKAIQLKNLKKEFDNYGKTISLKHIDVFQKHPDFCLNTSSPMTANKIREIRNTIRSKLNINVSYTNVFMQGLKRGIGIYSKDMPPVYNMIVQQLSQIGTLGYVIADVSLALGINMPFRSSCILGYKDSVDFKIDNYLQMIGRSGRRGMDCEGHIVYANVDWEKLMKGELADITSTYKHINNYNVIGKLNKDYNGLSAEVYKNSLDPMYTPENFTIKNNLYDEEFKNILLWKLREYNHKVEYFIDNLVNIEMSYRIEINSTSRNKLAKYLSAVFINDSSNYEEVNINTNSETNSDFQDFIKDILHFNKIDESYENLHKLTEFTLILKDIHNILLYDADNYYNFIKLHTKDLFIYLKKIIVQSNILNI